MISTTGADCDFPHPVARFSTHLSFTTLPEYLPENIPLAQFYVRIKSGAEIVEVYSTSYSIPGLDSKIALFDIDAIFRYLPFCNDHGPFNIGVVVRFHHLLQKMRIDERLEGYHLVLYSLEEPRCKSNAAFLAAIQALLDGRTEPFQITRELQDFEFMPFRDASQGRSEWELSIQDIIWGAYRAQQTGLLDLNQVLPDEYEKYEMPEHGDLNTIGPFVAFASPKEEARSPRLYKPKTVCVLKYFEETNVKAVVRLNDPLYDASIFTARDIGHLEMEFPDGSNPPLDLVRKFISYSDKVIKAGGKVATHCKAGLGRTGVMIGAYLIYKYGFAANEAIGFMRLIRRGMVVGPQQSWLVENAAQFICWRAVDDHEAVQRTAQLAIRLAGASPQTPPRRIKTGPMQTPAQPRKTPGKNGGYTTEEIPQPFDRVRKASPGVTPAAKRVRASPTISPMRQLTKFMAGTKPVSPERALKSNKTF